jgi:PGF-CTERM protein/PGF-pre-PGF domain-containing protein
MTTHTPPERLLVCLVVATVALAPLVGGAAALGATPGTGPAPGGAGADADIGQSMAVAQTDTAGELTLNVTNETDDTVTVTLETTATDVAGYQAHLTFDPDATAVESVSGGDGAFDVAPTTNVDNENGSVRFNAVAENGTESGVDAPTMATIVFDAPDAPTDVSFVAADSLLSTSDVEAVTDLTRNGVTLGDDGGTGGGDGSDGSDGGDGSDGSDGSDSGDGSDGSDGSGGTGGAPGGDDGSDGSDGSGGTGGAPGGDDGSDGSDGGGSGTGGAQPGGGDDGGDDAPAAVEAEVTLTDEGVSASAADVGAGSTVEMDLGSAVDGGGVTVDALSVETASAVDSITVEARSVETRALPADTPTPGASDAASYFEFETDAAPETVAGATVSFTADADALGVAPEDVAMFRLVDGEWTELDTTREGDGAYAAETPGFSYFAVSGTDDAGDSADADGSSDSDGSGDESDGDSAGDGSGSSAGSGGDSGGNEPILEEQTPGFGVLTASLAAVAAALIARRRG